MPEGLNVRRHTVNLVLLMYLIGFSHCSGNSVVNSILSIATKMSMRLETRDLDSANFLLVELSSDWLNGCNILLSI